MYERAEPAFGARAGPSARAGRTATSEWDGALGPDALDAIAELVPADRVLSPTSLENYAKCPQQFLIGDVLRVSGVEEPERTVRIDNCAAATCFTGSSSASTASGTGAGPASLAPRAEQRMRAIAEEECDAAEARGETGYPAMWAADRLEVIEDCLRWLEVERAGPRRGLLPLGAVRGAVRAAAIRREARRRCRVMSRSRSMSAGARCASPVGSTGSPGTRSRRPASG